MKYRRKKKNTKRKPSSEPEARAAGYMLLPLGSGNNIKLDSTVPWCQSVNALMIHGDHSKCHQLYKLITIRDPKKLAREMFSLLNTKEGKQFFYWGWLSTESGVCRILEAVRITAESAFYSFK